MKVGLQTFVAIDPLTIYTHTPSFNSMIKTIVCRQTAASFGVLNAGDLIGIFTQSNPDSQADPDKYLFNNANLFFPVEVRNYSAVDILYCLIYEVYET